LLSTPGTVVLFPHDRVNNEFRGGFRLNVGYWLDESQQVGIEGQYFFVHNSKQGTSVRSDVNNFGVPPLGRPFVNALTGLPDATLVSFPGVVFGSAEVRAENHASGAGVNLVYNLSASACDRLDALAGYRYLGVFDRVTYHTDAANFVALDGVPAGSRVQVMDRFRTLNHFNGVGVGLRGERLFGHFFVGGYASIALGGVRQILEVEGRTVTTSPGVPVRADFGGLYTQPGIINRFDRTAFAVVPEFGFRFGVQLTDIARMYFGYNWMYLSSVARAGDQIDTRVNPNFLPPRTVPVAGPQLPTFGGFRTTDFWIQGVTFGIELRF
jgi:hypothetical protein